MAVDQLHAETDRQLGQQRLHSDALATRAGLLIAVCTLLIGPLQNGQPLGEPLIWTVGITVFFGILILTVCRVAMGPSPVALTAWSNKSDPAESGLLDAKIITIEANTRALARADMLFWIQALGTSAAAVLAALHV